MVPNRGWRPGRLGLSIATAPTTTATRPASTWGTSSPPKRADGRSPTSSVSRSVSRDIGSSRADDLNQAGAAVDADHLSVMQASGSVSGADHGGNSVLSRDQGGVRSQGSPIGDHRHSPAGAAGQGSARRLQALVRCATHPPNHHRAANRGADYAMCCCPSWRTTRTSSATSSGVVRGLTTHARSAK
jgi:hypothetical protein